MNQGQGQARPRVLYVITSRGKGTGGHHFSLRDLTARMRAHADVHIAVVADRFPPSLEGVPDTTWLPWGALRGTATLGGLLGLVRRFRPTHLHSYDPLALQLTRLVSLWTRLPLVHTTCGGPTPRRNVPRNRDVILFSEENRSALAANPRMAGCRLHLIASRVNPVQVDPARVEALRAHLALRPDEQVVLRINRFVHNYLPAMEQALALGRLMREGGQPTRVVLLGSIGDADVASALAERAEAGVSLVHDATFTHNAAALLPIADVVLGTGRGLMEAACLGRVVFAPVADRQMPALLAADTVDALAHANFSPRARLPDALDDAALRERARAVLTNPDARRAAGAAARYLYETRFDAGVAAARHLEIYAQAEPWPVSRAAEALGDLGLNLALETFRRTRRALTQSETS